MRKKTTILHVNCNYMTTKLHQTMIQHLDGVDNIVFAPVKKKKKAVIKPDDYVVESRCINDYDRVSFYYKQHKIFRALSKSIKDFSNIDCVHAYTLFTDGNIAYKLYKKYKIPYVVAVRDTDVNVFFKYRPYLKRRGNLILKHAKKIFFLSSPYKELVIDKYLNKDLRKAFLNKTEIIPNGIDDYWLKDLFSIKDLKSVVGRIKERKLKLLFVGMILRRKNIDLILDAVCKLKNEGWNISFDVVGRIVDKRYFESLKENPDFNYLGEMDKDELKKCYREHDVFIMASKAETFGLVYAEAMSQGLPIIYTKNQGFDGQFENGVVGFSINIIDENDCLNAIINICNNYEVFYKNCISKVEKYNWKDICKRYVEIYAKINLEGE